MDILEQLLGLEKQAATLVAEAEAEAGRRKAAVRVEAQAAHGAVLRNAAEEIAATLEAERGRLTAEREARNAAYRGRLAARPVSKDEVARAARRFLAGDA